MSNQHRSNSLDLWESPWPPSFRHENEPSNLPRTVWIDPMAWNLDESSSIDGRSSQSLLTGLTDHFTESFVIGDQGEEFHPEWHWMQFTLLMQIIQEVLGDTKEIDNSEPSQTHQKRFAALSVASSNVFPLRFDFLLVNFLQLTNMIFKDDQSVFLVHV